MTRPETRIWSSSRFPAGYTVSVAGGSGGDASRGGVMNVAM